MVDSLNTKYKYEDMLKKCQLMTCWMFLFQDEIEKVQESQEKLQGDMKKMKRIVKELREQNSRIESMLRAIVTQSENINWQEEDYQEDEDELDQQTIENTLS